MIYGIGADIVEIARVSRLLERYGERFSGKILSETEHTAGRRNADAAYVAKRFAAKEAFAKALGTGIRHPAVWRRISVTHGPLGNPRLAFDPELENWMAERGVTRHHLSLADEKTFACAFVILES